MVWWWQLGRWYTQMEAEDGAELLQCAEQPLLLGFPALKCQQ